MQLLEFQEKVNLVYLTTVKSNNGCAIGLNIEQRKKLTIAVELSSRPELLLFLDEPSSGLDSQTSWAVLDLLRQLTSQGQAVLCTIHQPSAMLFERFDRLLFLAPEGRPVYFGDIGHDSSTVIQYFEQNGAKFCPEGANPAEWLMEIIGCTPGSRSEIDWPEVWRNSPEYAHVHAELDTLEKQLESEVPVTSVSEMSSEFAAPFPLQLYQCFIRVNQQYWRTPSYIYSKIALCVLTVSGSKSLSLMYCLLTCRHFFLDSPSTRWIIPYKDYRINHSISSCSCGSLNSI